MSVPDPIPHPSDLTTVQQDVTGDRNQVIGQISGGIVINQLIIHERVPATTISPPVAVTPTLTQQEYLVWRSPYSPNFLVISIPLCANN